MLEEGDMTRNLHLVLKFDCCHQCGASTDVQASCVEKNGKILKKKQTLNSCKITTTRPLPLGLQHMQPPGPSFTLTEEHLPPGFIPEATPTRQTIKTNIKI